MVDRRLGRGLDFFLSGGRGNPAPTPPAASRTEGQVATAKTPQEEVILAPLDQLRPSPYQPRKHIGEAELKELAASVGKSGLLQPILARRVGDGLEIVAGERRWRAAKMAGLKQVPVLVRTISDQESAVFGLVENLQREDLNALEKAQGFRLLMDQLGSTQEDVAARVGLDRSTVANFVRLLDLPPAVQEHVSRGTLSMGHARSLLALGDPETMVAAADDAIRNGLSVRALEARVKEALEASKGKPATAGSTGNSKSRPVWLNELEESLVDSLGTTVTIRYGRKRSQIVIDCGGREEFERIFQRLKGS